MSRLSLRLRLTLVFAAAMAVVLAAMGAFVFLRLNSSLTAAIDAELRTELQAEDTGHPPTSGNVVVVQLLSPDGLVMRGPGAPLLTGDELALASAGRRLLTSVEDPPGREGDWRVLARPTMHGGVLVAGAPLASVHDALRRLLTQLLVAGPVGLALASLAGWLLASAVLRPVEAMRRRAAVISAETPGERLPVPAGGDEIARLGATLNEMLERIEAGVERERRFVADASHELRTPLALLRTELELALRRKRPAEELEQALRSAAFETQRLTRIAEDLLLLARSQEGELPLQRRSVPVADLLAGVRGRFAPRAAESGREIAVEDADGLRVDADPLRLEQALDNLVENALRHGGGTIRIAASPAGGAVELHVADEGAGFPPEFLEQAFERFTRSDEARAGGGTGLGLAIVDVIARAHGGSAGAANRERGADVWISVPTEP